MQERKGISSAIEGDGADRSRNQSVGARRRPAWSTVAAWLLIAVLGLVHVLAGYGTSGVSDLMRDLYWADAIWRGGDWPLRGPPIHGTIELGPWWYYVNALALGATGSLAGTAAATSLLGAIKYPLAWWWGRRLGDARLGLLCVVALAIPLWSAAPLMYQTHTLMIEASMFALAFAALACRDHPTRVRGLLLGIAAALALHAHPTTALFVIAAGVFVLLHQRSRAWPALTVAVLVAAASLLPPLFAREDAVGEFATLLGQYAARDVGADPLTRVPLLLKGLIGGGWSGLVLFTPLERGHELALVAQCIALLLALAGLATGPRESPVARVGIAAGIALLAQALFLVLVRPTTPLWMMSTLLVPSALMLACGWWLFARRSIAWASVVGVAATIHVLLALGISWHSVRELESVRAAEGPPPLLDATAPFPTRFVDQPIARLRLRRLERAARLGCGATLHGDFAAGDENAIGLPTRRACGERRPVRYGGREGSARHVAGFVPASWCAIGLRPEGFAGGFGITTRLVALFPQQGPGWPQLAPTEVNLPPPSLQFTPVRVDALITRGSVLAITTRYRNFGESRLDLVSADGRSATLLHADNSSSFYACADCDGETQRWVVEGTGFDRAVDIIALQPMTKGPDACALR